MRISLVSKGDAGNTCPYCRDTIGSGEGRRCRGCKTTLHRECADELHKCPTPGCGRSLSRNYTSRRIRARPSQPTHELELSEGTKKGIAAVAVAVVLVGMCLSGSSKDKKRSRRTRRTHKPGQALSLPKDLAEFRRSVPKSVFEAGPPFQLNLEVREWDRTPLQVGIQDGASFVAPYEGGATYLALHRTELRIRAERSYAFPVVALDPKKWQDRPEGLLRLQSSLPAGRVRELARRWGQRRITGSPEAEAVAALWYLGHRGQLSPPPRDAVAREAELLLARLGGAPPRDHAPITPPRSTRRTRRSPPSRGAGLDRLLRDLRFDPTRRLRQTQLAWLGQYASDPRARNLVRQYLQSDDPDVQHLAFRWLKRHALPEGGETTLSRRLVTTSNRFDRILTLEALVKQGHRSYRPLQLIYGRDLAVDDTVHPRVVREHPKVAPLIEQGFSLYRAWLQVAGWQTVPGIRNFTRDKRMATARVLERDEEAYVTRTLEALRPGSAHEARRLATQLSRLARRFPHHPALWRRLEQLAGHPSRWVRTLAINAATRGYYGGRILARVVNDSRKLKEIRRDVALGSRYLNVARAIEVWEAASRGPPIVQRAVFPLVAARRLAIKDSAQLGLRLGRILERMSSSPEADIRKQSIELVFALDLPNAFEVLRRSQADPSRARLAIAAAARSYRKPGAHTRKMVEQLRLLARFGRPPLIRSAAIRAVASYGHSAELVKILTEAMEASDSGVRAAAARAPLAIKKLDPWQAMRYTPILKAALGDGKPTVRLAGLAASLKLRGATGVRQAGLEDTDRSVRQAAYRALLPRHRTEARRVLFGWLRRTDLRDQKLAVEALTTSFRGDRYARKKLKGLRDHRDEEIRKLVRAYLSAEPR